MEKSNDIERTSDGGNRSHNVSLPIILKKTKVGQILQYSCISLLIVPILLYWIQVSVSLNVLLYFGAEMATFCIIMQTSPCYEYPLTPHFYIVKLGFTGVYLIFALKHRLWVHVRTASLRGF